MSEVVLPRPLQKLDQRHQHGPQPDAFSLSASRTASFRPWDQATDVEDVGNLATIAARLYLTPPESELTILYRF